MNKNSEPLPTGSDRGSVFCLSGHRKLDRPGDLKTGECGFYEGAANSGISSQSREDALGSRYRSSQPAVNRTCDADLAQKIIGAPCRSFPGVSSSRCSSANDDQCSVNRNQNSNKVSAPAFSSASSLPRHRTLSASHGSVLSQCGTGSIRCEDRRLDSRKNQLTMSRLQGKERDRTPWKY